MTAYVMMSRGLSSLESLWSSPAPGSGQHLPGAVGLRGRGQEAGTAPLLERRRTGRELPGEEGPAISPVSGWKGGPGLKNDWASEAQTGVGLAGRGAGGSWTLPSRGQRNKRGVDLTRPGQVTVAPGTPVPPTSPSQPRHEGGTGRDSQSGAWGASPPDAPPRSGTCCIAPPPRPGPSPSLFWQKLGADSRQPPCARRTVLPAREGVVRETHV